MTDKIVLVVTHGPESPELATIPFVIATAAQASDVEVVMVFQAEGMWLLRKGMAKTVAAHAYPPLNDLLEAYIEAGGKLFACGPCVKARQLDPEKDLIEGALVVNAGVLVREFTEAKSTLVY